MSHIDSFLIGISFGIWVSYLFVMGVLKDNKLGQSHEIYPPSTVPDGPTDDC